MDGGLVQSADDVVFPSSSPARDPPARQPPTPHSLFTPLAGIARVEVGVVVRIAGRSHWTWNTS